MALSGRLKDPIPSFTRLLSEAEASGNIFDKQFIRSYLLMFCSANGDEIGWRELIDRSRSEARDYGLARWLGWIQARLSDAALQQGRLDDALAEANIAILSSRLSQETDYMLSASKTEFDAHLLKGDFGKALSVVSRLLDSVQFNFQRPDSARVLIEAGYALNEIRRSRMALDVIVDGVERANRANMDPSVLFFAETNLGSIYENLHDTLSALRSFQHALNSVANSGFRKKNMPVAAGNLARLQMISGEPNQANRLIRIEDSLANACGSRVERANAYFNRGESLRRRNTPNIALTWFHKCDSLAETMHSIPLQIDVKRKIASTLLASGIEDSAYVQNLKIAKLYDSLTLRIPPFICGVDFWDLEVYRDLISESFRRQKISEAISWFEQTRISASRRIRSFSLISREAAYARDERVCKALLNLANSRVNENPFDLPSPADKTRETIEFLKNAAQASDFWVNNNLGAKLNSNFRAVKLTQIQEGLGSDEVLLASSISENRLNLLCVAKDTVSLSQVTVSRHEVIDLVRRLSPTRNKYQVSDMYRRSDDSSDAQSPSRVLSRLILSPFSNLIDHKFHMIVVPDGILSNISFELLRDKSGRPLIETHCVSYQMTFGDVISRKTNHAMQPADMLFVGNDNDGIVRSLVFDKRYIPFTRVSEAGFLPGVRKELEELRARLGNRFDEITNGLATKSRILAMAPVYAVVHIAAHGRPDVADPIASTLAISAESLPFEDARSDLSPLDVAGDVWNSDLVYLSACGTAEGDAEGGADGFVTAFRSSGVGCVIASLSDIDDGIAASVVGRFYSKLAVGVPSVEALRYAKLELINEGVNPQLLAPIVLFGTNASFSTFTSHHRSGEWDRVSLYSMTLYFLVGCTYFLVNRRQSIHGKKCREGLK